MILNRIRNLRKSRYHTVTCGRKSHMIRIIDQDIIHKHQANTTVCSFRRSFNIIRRNGAVNRIAQISPHRVSDDPVFYNQIPDLHFFKQMWIILILHIILLLCLSELQIESSRILYHSLYPYFMDITAESFRLFMHD